MKYFFLFVLLSLTACKSENKKKASQIPTNELKEPVEKTTYYLIRHAEKDLSDPTDHDPYLTEEGLARAQFWAEYFSDKSIEMIYATQYNRTVQTVIPTLDTTKLQLIFYEPDSLYSPEFLEKTKGKKVLIVGHQSSVPKLANKLLGENRYKKISAEVYNNLFIIEFEVDGSKNGMLKQIDSKKGPV